MSLADWFKPLPPSLPAATVPLITPAQVITEILTQHAIATQGELLDACKAKGLTLNYSGLWAELRSLQQAGVITSRFATVDLALAVLVYQRRH